MVTVFCQHGLGHLSPHLAPVRRDLVGGGFKAVHFGLEVEQQLVAFAVLQPFGPERKTGGLAAQIARGLGHGRGGARLGNGRMTQRADRFGRVDDRRGDGHDFREQFALLRDMAEQVIHASR